MADEKSRELDVIVLTKNSEKHLENCLTCIFEALPVHHLIIVDGYSTDRTLDIIETFRCKYGNVILIRESALRGKAREIGIRNVDTEWFMFVDSDVIIYPVWFSVALKYFESKNVGAIQLGGRFKTVLIREYTDLTSELRKLRKLAQRKPEWESAFTGAVAIRTEVVKSWNVPAWLNYYEDVHLKRYVEEKGYVWLIDSETVTFEHLHVLDSRLYQAAPRIFGAYERMLGYRSLGNLMVNLFKMPLKSVLASLMSQNPRVISYNLKWWLRLTHGWLKWEDYYK